MVQKVDLNENLSGDVLVLKDTWSEASRTEEGVIYDLLNSTVQESPHFLTIQVHGVIPPVNPVKDSIDWSTAKRWNPAKPPPSHVPANIPKQSRHPVGSVTPAPTILPGSNVATYKSPQSPLHILRRHHRLVFAERGMPFIDLTSDKDAFVALKGAVKGQSCVSSS